MASWFHSRCAGAALPSAITLISFDNNVNGITKIVIYCKPTIQNIFVDFFDFSIFNFTNFTNCGKRNIWSYAGTMSSYSYIVGDCSCTIVLISRHCTRVYGVYLLYVNGILYWLLTGSKLLKTFVRIVFRSWLTPWCLCARTGHNIQSQWRRAGLANVAITSNKSAKRFYVSLWRVLPRSFNISRHTGRAGRDFSTRKARGELRPHCRISPGTARCPAAIHCTRQYYENISKLTSLWNRDSGLQWDGDWSSEGGAVGPPKYITVIHVYNCLNHITCSYAEHNVIILIRINLYYKIHVPTTHSPADRYNSNKETSKLGIWPSGSSIIIL